MDYVWLKWLHILSATLLFGLGVGSAFYLLAASLSPNLQGLALVSRLVVWADGLFTATTVVVQPLTGYFLVRQLGLPWSSFWLVGSVALYVLAVLCWLPVVWLQLRMRDLAAQAVREGVGTLPPAYVRLLRWWVALGVVAFFCFLGIFYLMVAKPY